MSYVDAIIDRDKDLIKIVERVNGKRKHVILPAHYSFYYTDPNGQFDSIYGDKLSRFSTKSKKEFNRERKIHSGKTLFETDLNPVFDTLAKNYMNAEPPELHKAFFDIEVDFCQTRGYSDPSDPFNPITAVAVHLAWLKRTFCLVVAPKGLSDDVADAICQKFPDTHLMKSERELLMMFLDLIEDVDVYSGWNSEGYDVPYVINRVARELGKEYTRKMCLWDQYPTVREYERYGKVSSTYDTVGRVHLDYLALYRKYTYHEMHSYSLDAIAEYELDEHKTPYEGTLDQLYNNDFELFITYNRQDVDLLVRLDQKLQFIDLSNVLAHGNTVLLQTTMGAVAQTDQAIVNEAHERGIIVMSKTRHESVGAAGAYVAQPKKGFHESIGSIDLNSLYPSIIRACNMSPETIVGQVRHTLTDQMLTEFKTIPLAWDGKFACMEYELVMNEDKDTMLYLDFEDGSHVTATGAEIYDLIFNSGEPWIISANGTIFRHDKKGVIPGLLERWYAERKVMQGNVRTARRLLAGIDIDQELSKQIQRLL